MTPPTSSPVITRAPHGRACHSCSPASTSIRANTANAVGPRPSAFFEDPSIQAQGPTGVRQPSSPTSRPPQGSLFVRRWLSEPMQIRSADVHVSAVSYRNVATEGEARRVRPGTRTRFGSASSTRTSASRVTAEPSSSQPGGSAPRSAAWRTRSRQLDEEGQLLWIPSFFVALDS